jgi:hypothetical protein
VHFCERLYRRNDRLPHLIPHRLSQIPSWQTVCPVFNFGPIRHVRGASSALCHIPLVFLQTTFLLPGPHSGVHWQVVGWWIDSQCLHIWRPLHNCNSVFTPQLYAIYRALLFIQHRTVKCHLVCTDSLSALQSLSGHAHNHLRVTEILIQVSHLHKRRKYVIFCWVPVHTSWSSKKAANTEKSAALYGTLVSNTALGNDFPLSFLVSF